MSGNLRTGIVSFGNEKGRSFEGTHGDGELTLDGFANIANWPGYDGNANNSYLGAGRKGGSWLDEIFLMTISRRSTAVEYNNNRYKFNGFRAVRTK